MLLAAAARQRADSRCAEVDRQDDDNREYGEKITNDRRVPAGAARKRARKAERARKAKKRSPAAAGVESAAGMGAANKETKMADNDDEANAARNRACILTEGRSQPFCSLCKIDIVDTPKAIKAVC